MKKLALALLVILTFTSVSYAFSWKNNRSDQPYRAYEHLSTELNLSKTQLQKIKKIIFKFEKEIIPIRSNIKMLYVNLKESFIKEKVRKDEMRNIIKSISVKKNNIQLKKIDKLFEIKKLLTPEQRAKIQDLHLFSNFLGGNMYNHPYKTKHRGFIR
jgi:Spy/CpxP family protein refolding chaperone